MLTICLSASSVLGDPQDLARREQSRRDWDAWLTTQRLKRARVAEDREAFRLAKTQGKDWRDPEGGVEMGMGRREREREEGGGRRGERGKGGGGEEAFESQHV